MRDKTGIRCPIKQNGFRMNSYIAPKIIRSWWIITGLMVGIVPAIWAIETTNSYVRGVLTFSIFWITLTLFTWFWYGRYAKRIDLTDDMVHVISKMDVSFNFPGAVLQLYGLTQDMHPRTSQL